MKLRMLLILQFVLFCRISASPPPADSLEQLVRAYEKITHPEMTNPYMLFLAMHEVSGLWDSLGISLFAAEYRSTDGTWFRKEEFLYKKGAIRYFTDCYGGWGLMSGQMMGSVLYYTFSFGSGIHRSHIGRLSIDHDTIVTRESGGYAFRDLYVA